MIKFRFLRWRDYLEGPDEIITVLIRRKWEVSESEIGDLITERGDCNDEL